MKIGEKIKVLREKKEWSQSQLARKASTPENEINQPTIARIESGETKNPTWDTICQIATALEVSLEEFFKTGATAKPIPQKEFYDKLAMSLMEQWELADEAGKAALEEHLKRTFKGGAAEVFLEILKNQK